MNTRNRRKERKRQTGRVLSGVTDTLSDVARLRPLSCLLSSITFVRSSICCYSPFLSYVLNDRFSPIPYHVFFSFTLGYYHTQGIIYSRCLFTINEREKCGTTSQCLFLTVVFSSISRKYKK